MVVTRANRPQVGPVLARLCTRSTPSRRAQRGSMQLLAAHPVRRRLAARSGIATCSTASIHGPPARGRLAVDERGEPAVGGRLAKRRDQLAGIDLGPAGLAGDQVDEVEPDVHRVDWPAEAQVTPT